MIQKWSSHKIKHDSFFYHFPWRYHVCGKYRYLTGKEEFSSTVFNCTTPENAILKCKLLFFLWHIAQVKHIFNCTKFADIFIQVLKNGIYFIFFFFLCVCRRNIAQKSMIKFVFLNYFSHNNQKKAVIGKRLYYNSRYITFTEKWKTVFEI